MSKITPTACPQPERSELRTRIVTGELSPAEAILTCPSEIGGMPVAQLLASQRGWDEARSRAFLAQAAVNEDKSLGSLTERQRRAIASLLTRQSGARGSTQPGPPPVREPMPMRRRSLNEAAHKLPVQVGAHGHAR